METPWVISTTSSTGSRSSVPLTVAVWAMFQVVEVMKVMEDGKTVAAASGPAARDTVTSLAGGAVSATV